MDCSLAESFSAPPRITERPDPCNPSPCGSNADCTERSGAASCRCIQDYFGDPYVACRPECTINADCPSNKACSRLHCVDPCPGLCGTNAQCRVINHIPTCTCNQGYQGDPFSSCRLRPIRKNQYFFVFNFNTILQPLSRWLRKTPVIPILVVQTACLPEMMGGIAAAHAWLK